MLKGPVPPHFLQVWTRVLRGSSANFRVLNASGSMLPCCRFSIFSGKIQEHAVGPADHAGAACLNRSKRTFLWFRPETGSANNMCISAFSLGISMNKPPELCGLFFGVIRR
jgi:hypothetical protein